MNKTESFVQRPEAVDDLPTQRAPVQIVSVHYPKVTTEYDMFGGVDIKLDDFVFIHINYDYRYTDNAHRARVAEQIVEMLCPSPAASENDEERSA